MACCFRAMLGIPGTLPLMHILTPNGIKVEYCEDMKGLNNFVAISYAASRYVKLLVRKTHLAFFGSGSIRTTVRNDSLQGVQGGQNKSRLDTLP